MVNTGSLIDWSLPWNSGSSPTVAKEKSEFALQIDKRIGSRVGEDFSYGIMYDEAGAGDRTLVIEFDPGRLESAELVYLWEQLCSRWGRWRVFLGVETDFLVLTKNAWGTKDRQGECLESLMGEFNVRRDRAIASQKLSADARLRVMEELVKVLRGRESNKTGAASVQFVASVRCEGGSPARLLENVQTPSKLVWISVPVATEEDLWSLNERLYVSWSEPSGFHEWWVDRVWVEGESSLKECSIVDEDLIVRAGNVVYVEIDVALSTHDIAIVYEGKRMSEIERLCDE